MERGGGQVVGGGGHVVRQQHPVMEKSAGVGGAYGKGGVDDLTKVTY